MLSTFGSRATAGFAGAGGLVLIGIPVPAILVISQYEVELDYF